MGIIDIITMSNKDFKKYLVDRLSYKYEVDFDGRLDYVLVKYNFKNNKLTINDSINRLSRIILLMELKDFEPKK